MKAIILTKCNGSKLCIGTDNFIAAKKDSKGTAIRFSGMDADYEETVIETPEEIAELINNQ